VFIIAAVILSVLYKVSLLLLTREWKIEREVTLMKSKNFLKGHRIEIDRIAEILEGDISNIAILQHCLWSAKNDRYPATTLLIFMSNDFTSLQFV
jgi:hypothetical protein